MTPKQSTPEEALDAVRVALDRHVKMLEVEFCDCEGPLHSCARDSAKAERDAALAALPVLAAAVERLAAVEAERDDLVEWSADMGEVNSTLRRERDEARAALEEHRKEGPFQFVVNPDIPEGEYHFMDKDGKCVGKMVVEKERDDAQPKGETGC